MNSAPSSSTIPQTGAATHDVQAVPETDAARRDVGGLKDPITDRRHADSPPADVEQTKERELGRGRSGVVYLSRDDNGCEIARKVFGTSGVTKAVQYAFLGAPNPYVWSEPAIRSALMRRRILAELVEFWFGSRLRVARARGYRWNPGARAFEMSCELVHGRHVALHHPYTGPDNTELADVRRHVMKPLQKHLAEAGFDGLVWQAGRGNPVALNNFMCDGRDDSGGYRWVWIDLESGVPALIPFNPLDLVRFYLPKSWRHRRPLFDDVDTDQLRRYVDARRDELRKQLGDERVCQIEADVESLQISQHTWKSLARHRRSIAFRCSQGAIDREQADWYAQHPVHWYAGESVRAVRSAGPALVSCLQGLVVALANVKFGRLLEAGWNAIRSRTYRERLARDYVGGRITQWRQRGQLSQPDAERLDGHLHDEEGSAYLADFGVHLAVKPVVKALQLWVLPVLWMVGLVDDVFLALFLVFAGSVARTLYTLARMIQDASNGREKPWIALIVGVVPVVGNVAYPVQMIMTGSSDHGMIARFILFDTFSRFSQWVPIWGGRDTLTEHLLNRCPHVLTPMIRWASPHSRTAFPASIPAEPASPVDPPCEASRRGR